MINVKLPEILESWVVIEKLHQVHQIVILGFKQVNPEILNIKRNLILWLFFKHRGRDNLLQLHWKLYGFEYVVVFELFYDFITRPKH